MLLTYDLDAGLWVLAPGSRFAPAKPQLTRGDTPVLDVQFCRGATVVELDNAATFKCGLKKLGVFSSGYLAYTPDVAVLNHSRTITGSSVASPTVITCAGHGRATGETVTISGHTGSTPDINGEWAVTVLSPDTFSIPEAVSIAGTGGTMTPARSPIYRFAPGLNTTAIAAALLTAGTTPTDLPSIEANLEIEITSGTDITSTAKLVVTLNNDVNRGNEGATTADPIFPTAFQIIVFRTDLTSFTGGASSLESLLLTAADLGRVFAMVATDEGVESHWRVEAGTDSTNGPGGVVRPANYATGTNEVVLHRIS
jgi:hypothetical protein